jgi:hypothetical protein
MGKSERFYSAVHLGEWDLCNYCFLYFEGVAVKADLCGIAGGSRVCQ